MHLVGVWSFFLCPRLDAHSWDACAVAENAEMSGSPVLVPVYVPSMTTKHVLQLSNWTSFIGVGAGLSLCSSALSSLGTVAVAEWVHPVAAGFVLVGLWGLSNMRMRLRAEGPGATEPCGQRRKTEP